jgi:thioredoxin 1
MIDINDQDFDKEVLDCDLPVFTCFTTKWSQSCYPTCLVAAELAKEYNGRVKFVRVDIEESPETVERYNVVPVPTILLFQDSQPVKRLLGFQEPVSLRSALNSAIVKEELPYK